MHIATFNERAQALENAFFYQVDQQLLEKLRQQLSEQETKEALKAASGITDDRLLTELVSIGVRPETLSAVSLIPLVMVAWADGKIDDDERRAVIQAEEAAAISQDDMSHQMLEHWLNQRPSDSLLETWEHCIKTLRESLSAEGNELLGEEVLKRGLVVAKSSGGALGIEELTLDYGSVSPSEHRLLKRIKDIVRS